MIAERLRPIGWVVAVALTALAFYLVSLRVANERSAVERADRAIAAAERDIRRLTTELATRGSLHQLEQWNREVLALTSPAVGQYLQGQRELAAYSVDGFGDLRPADAPQVMQASAEAGAGGEEGGAPRLIRAVVEDAAAAPVPVIRTAAVAPARVASPQPAPVAARAATARPAPRPQVARAAEPQSLLPPALAPRPAATLQRASYTPTLLASRTLDDIARQAASEAAGR